MRKFKLSKKDLVHHVGRGESTQKLIDLCDNLAKIEARSYDGELGAIYSPDQTEFRLWAPTAISVNLIIYDSFYGPESRRIPMQSIQEQGLFHYTLQGDQHGTTYRYELTFVEGITRNTNDPYMRASTANGRRAVVVDLARTNPEHWSPQRKEPMEDLSQAVIYEVNIHDFTISTSGCFKNRGKYLGMIEEGTINNMGSATGLDYLKELGVTHVQIMPFFDFATIDETAEVPEEADNNWGYDPQNFNVPEGSYSVDPYNPFTRITEVKQMIQGLHDAGIRVIMDVVYNHVYQVEKQSLHNTVPGYYFRYTESGQYSNGTGVGNETASERIMMRKYILESVRYWAEEYHIDGFRFDLMGIHDIETMNAVRQALDEIDPSIFVYGEGWNLPSILPENQRAILENGTKLPRIGHYNPTLREALKGNDFDIRAKGFVNGAWYMEGQLCHSFLGYFNGSHFDTPQQLVQYVEAHDNYTLYDRLIAGCDQCPIEMVIKQHELASTIIMLAQGIPHIHSGQEFLRSKDGVRDSYNQPDEINKIDWQRREEFPHSVKLMRKLIEYRKAEPLFRMTSYEEIKERVTIVRNEYQVVALKLVGDDYELFIVLNGRRNPVRLKLPQAEYSIKLFDGRVFLDDEQWKEELEDVEIPELTAAVYKRIIQ